MAEQKVGRGSDQFPLRLPDGMREKIKERADSNGRSMNAELVSLLAFGLEENIWERQKFIDTLNFKQHIIEKQMHILFADAGQKRALEDMVAYERALRISTENTLQALCQAVIESDARDELKETARKVLTSEKMVPDLPKTEQIKEDLRRRVGDRDDVATDWEKHLSDEDAKHLSESRKWAKDYE